MLEMDKMLDQNASDRRRTARIPTGARMLHRAVGMTDYALCEVLNVTTSGIEMLAEQPLEPGSVVTILVRPEGSPRKYYRLVGSVERRERKLGRWLHVVRSSNRRPWSSMFIYDVMFQALTGSKNRLVPEWIFVENDAEPHRIQSDGDTAAIAELEQAASRDGPADIPDAESYDGDPAVYRALARLVPFNEFSDLLRRFIARELHITRKPVGTTLIERGSMDNISIYLIEGTVTADAHDGKKFSITGGTNDARFPISVLRPHAYTVKAVTDVNVILFTQDKIRQLVRITASYKNRLGIEVSEGETMPAGTTDV